MDYMLHLSASESLYDGPEFGTETPGPLYKSNQPETLTLGPFPDYIELTYEYIRTGPDGEHIAAFDCKRGVWVVGVNTEQRGVVNVMKGHDPDGTVWSDVVIMGV
jgi:hypothetical protein